MTVQLTPKMLEGIDARARAPLAPLFEKFNAVEVLALLTHMKWQDEELTIHKQAVREMQGKIDRLQDNVVQLDREKRQLQEQFDAKKVVLPKEAAEAIDYYESYGSLTNTGIINCIINENGKIASKARKALEQRVGEEAGDILMRALVNGYTVEEQPTTEERLEAKLLELFRTNEVCSAIPHERLAVKLSQAIREVLAEDRQAETTN